MPIYYVYVMASKRNTALYIGVTGDLKKRVKKHKSGLYSGFTRRYNIHKLVYFECYKEIAEAITREKRLKKWRREWKNNLVNSKNAEWLDLYYLL